MQRLGRSLFRELNLLRKRAGRHEQNLLLVPGFKCSQEYLLSGGSARYALIREDRKEEALELLTVSPGEGPELLLAKDHELSRLSDQNQPEGLMLVAPPLVSRPNLSPQIILDGLQDPGNLGSVIRSALWFGLDRVWLVEPCADPFSPRGIRATMGALFRLKMCRTMSAENLGEELPGLKGRLLYLSGDGDTSLDSFQYRDTDILVLGSESHGLRQEPQGDGLRLSIPGCGHMESLNAGHAFTCAAWERFRQLAPGTPS